jgi:enediyne biosynthesis thioesterase
MRGPNTATEPARVPEALRTALAGYAVSPAGARGGGRDAR